MPSRLAPNCPTAKVAPAMAIVPNRWKPVLAGTSTLTVPVPAPETGPLMATHAKEFATDHGQPLCVVIVMVPVLPVAGNDWSVGLMA